VKTIPYVCFTNKHIEIMATDLKEIKIRLEVLRREIRKEGISYGELMELQSYAKHIDKNDVELLEWAGVGEGLN